jgi:disulfide bond formation protein DsbB
VSTAGGISNLNLARALALLVPAALLAGAWSFQIWGHLFPCHYCWWQRYAHLVAAALALIAIAVASRPPLDRVFLVLAALAIFTSGMIGVYHAGVEAGIFPGITSCSTTIVTGTNPTEVMDQIMRSPVVRCDEVQWRFLGVSMAGWNAILSILFAALILWLTFRRPRAVA